MSARILAYIQAAVLAMSSVQTTASTIPTDYPVLAIEAETASETETETQEKTETEKQDVTETETETQEKTETEKQDVTETETQDETETQEKTETEDTTGTEDETGTETEDVSETETEDVTGTETEEMTETETEDATETEDETETEDVQEIEIASESGIDTAQYLTTVDAVGEKLRESLTNREAEITVYYQTTEEPGSEIAAEIWDKALEHTGKPTQGDYLLFQYESLEIPDYDIIVEPSASAKNGETPCRNDILFAYYI